MNSSIKNTLHCPLCGNPNKLIEDSIDTHELKNIWQEQTAHLNEAVDISRISDITTKIDYHKCSKCDLGFFNPQIPGDNQFYGDLAQDSLYYLHEGKSEFDYSTEHITKGSCVLDVGSGRGVFSKYLDSSIDYTGLELSSEAVQLAKEDQINVLNMTIEDFEKTTQKKYDFIVSFQVLEHIEDIESFMNSIKKLLKEDGKIIFAVPNNQSFIRKTPNHILNLPPHHLLHWNNQSLTFLASHFNLKVKDIFCERLSKTHLRAYLYSLTYDFIRRILFIPYRQIRESFVRKIISKISWKFASIAALINSNLFKNTLGQTIIISMQKK